MSKVVNVEMLQAITPEESRARMGRGGRVNWINRGETEVEQLRRHDRVVIAGRMKVGKTREARAHYSGGLARFELGDLQAAIDDYDQTVALDPHDASAHYHRGLVRKELDDLEGALEDYTQALTLDPEYAEAYAGKASVHALRGEMEEACASLEGAIGLDGGFRMWSGRAEGFAGLWGEARFEALVVGEG